MQRLILRFYKPKFIKLKFAITRSYEKHPALQTVPQTHSSGKYPSQTLHKCLWLMRYQLKSASVNIVFFRMSLGIITQSIFLTIFEKRVQL